MRQRRGVSVIVGSVMLILIAVAASYVVYEFYAPSMVPTLNTAPLLENIKIVNVDVSNSTGTVNVNLVNSGNVNVTIDYIYIETLSQNMIYLNQTNPTDPNRFISVGQTSDISFTVPPPYNTTISSGAVIFKVVTTRGTAASFIYTPPTSAPPQTSQNGGGSSVTQLFNITVFKFNDTNLDGVYEPQLGEEPVNNFLFIMEDQNGNQYPGLTGTEGNPPGTYVYTGLNKGIYTIYDMQQIDPISGYPWNCSTVNTMVVPIISDNAYVQFGNFLNNPVYSITGRVFNDVNQNGIYDSGVDQPLANWIVLIKYQSGPGFLYAVTDSSGMYKLTSLNPGNYSVKEILQPGWIPITGTSHNILITNQSLSGLDFGNFYVGSNSTSAYAIGGMVFNDTNKDGVYDSGDNPLGPNWLLTIDNGSGYLYGITTNANGNYTFNVAPGTYTLSEILPLGWVSSTGYSKVVTVTNASVYGVDFGNYYSPPQIYSISGRAFNDTNQNGVYNSGVEQPLANWIVYYTDGGMLHYVLTDSNGTYRITSLASGVYPVSIYLNSSWTNTTVQTIDVNVNSSSVTGVDFGLRPLTFNNITCFVYSDMNLNGVYDAGDYPLPNWTVSANSTYFASTDANGTAIFNNLPAGVYSVSEFMPTDPNWHSNSNTTVTVDIRLNPGNVSFANYCNAPKTVMGMVFNDTDHSGTITGAEFGVSSVTVWMSNTTGSFSTQTNATGYYNFTGILNGTCTVQIVLPGGYTNSTSKVVTLAVNPTDTTITLNFGIYMTSANATYSISGFKFNDTNSNGIYDSGTEVKIQGWRFYLYNGIYNGTGYPIANVTTDATGTYTFPNVNNGTYSVVEASQSGWVNTTSAVQVVVVNGKSMTANFGNNYIGGGTGVYIYSIGGMVFNDTDKNGQLNGAERGYAGAIVVLNDYRGLPLAFAVTDANGNYNFTSLANGSCTVNLILPTGYTNTTRIAVPVTIAGLNVNGINFGIFQSNATVFYSISGLVFNDSNKNGVFDGSDVGLAGWTIVLFNGTYNGTGAPFANSTTTSTGNYSFGGLVNGNYTVIELMNSGYYNTTLRSRLITISNGSVMNNNFGNYPNSTSTYTISGFVFNDVDHNGVFNASDTGYGAVYIQLNDNSGLPIAYAFSSSTAGTLGFYIFTGLSSGAYTIYIQVPSGYTNSTQTRVTPTITNANITINFGIWKTSTNPTYYISGWKWNDTNGNGVWETGENGMGTWSIWLYTGNYLGGVPVGVFPTTVITTNGTLSGSVGSGFYGFSGLANGTYTVIETWVNGYNNTTALAKLVTIAGAGVGNINFSNTRVPLQNYTISGRVYNDTDSSGSWTQGDTGYASMSYVYINSPQGFPMTRLTTSSSPAGNYTFSGLGNGTYRVYISVPSGYTNTTASSVSVTVVGANITGTDFGVHKTAAAPTYSIGGFEFNDTNGDGIYNPATDPLMSGWTIMLYNGTYSGTQFPITPIQTTASGTGAYLYSNLAPGTYTVVELMQNGWINSNATRYAVVTITNTSLQVIFGSSKTGVVPTYTVSGYIFNDSNRNGILDNGEVYSGTLNAYADDSLGMPYAYVTTNSTCYYTLSGLPNGVYTIYPQIPSGWTNSTTARITVTISGSNIAGKNFGIYMTSANATYSISGFKFNDTNKNGAYDSGEQGIIGWPVYLYSGTYNGTGFPIYTNSTAGNGNFSFSNLNNGTYTVVEGMLNGYATSMPREQFITISGNSTSNVIFGNYKITPIPPYSITGLVFNDTYDKDGVFNGPDNGYSGATVWLNDASGIPIGSTTTNSTGYYTFSGLSNGTYTVYLQMPSGWTNSTSIRFSVTISGSSVQVQNIGIWQQATSTYWFIEGYTFNDTNGNGVWDTGENGAQGWTAELFNGVYNGTQIPTQTYTTDANGHYIFLGLTNGTYTVMEMVQSGWANTTLAQKVVTISSPITVNFGNRQVTTCSVIGKVFNDTFSNGVYNASDPPLTGWTVLLNGSYSTTTDANGNYSFTGLSSGAYTVSVVVQSGWQNTTASSVVLNIATGSQIQNFGLKMSVPVYSMTGFVFNDTLHNGIYNSSVDPLIGGWMISLMNASGSLQFASTNSSGYYVFPSLPAGTYAVQEASQAGWSNTTASSVNVTIVNSSISNVNFGNMVNNTIVTTYTLSGMIYNDINKDGVYEPGTDGVLQNWYVTLKDQSGHMYLTSTDASGQYIFSNLPSGTYTVRDIPLTDWANSTATVQSVSINYASVTGINFGNYYDKYSVTGYVYFDSNGNKVYDTGDYPLQGWTVNLTNVGTGAKLYTSTISSGYYNFTGLTSGNYTLTVITQQGWISTTATTVNINLNSNFVQSFGNIRAFNATFYLSYSAADWSTDPSMYLSNDFTNAYSSGFVQIGSPAQWHIEYSNITIMCSYLSNQLTGSAFTQQPNPEINNPGTPGGIFGADVLALSLNLEYSNEGVGAFNPGFGSLTLYNSTNADLPYKAAPSTALDGMTVTQILGIANQVLGGNSTAMPSGYSVSDLDTLLQELNSAFHSGVSSWAVGHLF